MSNNNQPKKSVGYLTDDSGNPSSMRMMSLISLIAAICIGSITMFKEDAQYVGINLTYSFLVAAFTPKTVQKFAENKANSDKLGV